MGVCGYFKVGVALEKWAWPQKFSGTLRASYLLASPVLKLVYTPGMYVSVSHTWEYQLILRHNLIDYNVV